MTETAKPFLQVLSGQALDTPPVWLMRQAGRYLSEYREVRAKAENFVQFCLSPDLATEVTLQPIRRFGFDASILFADILLIPIALGRKVWFVTGEGPKLEPFDPLNFESLLEGRSTEVLGNVGETVRRVSASLPDHVTMIGFAGSPWTVATYMVEGGGSKDRFKTRVSAWEHPEAFDAFRDRIADATSDYLEMQYQAGAECLKLFDSWAEGLPRPLFERVIIRPTKRIVDGLRARGVDCPVIGFPRGASTLYPHYAEATGVTGMALDTGVDPAWMRPQLPEGFPVQGHLDPSALRAGGTALDSEVRRLRAAWSGHPHIFNLGHGITPDVPVSHVEQLLHLIRNGDA